MLSPRDFFEAMLREHADMLQVFLKASVRDPQLRDELFQETVVTAWMRLEDFDRERPFGKWLRGIARMKILAQTGRSREWVSSPEVLEELDDRFHLLQQQLGDTLDEKLTCLRECIQGLPPRYRETIDLRYFEGHKGQGLAERLDTSLENAKKLLLRSRKQLSACMERKLAPRKAWA